MKFQHPQNGYVEESAAVWLWTFLLGSIYFAVKGVWRHVVASLLLALVTGGISWFVYPFFAETILRNHYLRSGWIEIKE
jgi:hypothetical protein